jgi:hypothetical protein
VIRVGDTIYIGGSFTSVRSCPPGTACGAGNSYAVSNVAALDATTGAGIKSFHPAVTGGDTPTVYALAVLGGKVFIGGRFTTVGGEPHENFAAVDATTGAVDSSITDQINGTATTNNYVKALLASSDRVYVGGYFNRVNGIARPHLAAFDSSGNLDTKWHPRTDDVVSSLAFSCDNSSIYVGGRFRNAAPTNKPMQDRETIAKFDLVNGTLDPWQIVPGVIPHDVNAFDLAVSPA